MTKSYMAKPADVVRQWHVVDAEGKILGRLATRLATVLCGKHRPTFTPHVDTGDFVVVVNAAKVRVTGRKLDQKPYHILSRRPGHMRTKTLREMMATRPDQVIREAVRRMLPHSNLGRRMLRKLKIFKGSTHPHAAQNPQPLAMP
ncbi:MAG TPA: 50S ribosomal protein L13 [Planctomycetota bacterium]|nr:50S ribosomal protein L13 [Planctomycetota bacterium]